MQHEISVNGWLVGGRNAGELSKLAAFRPRVQTFGIALAANVERCCDMDFDEPMSADNLPRVVTMHLKRADQRDNADLAPVGHFCRQSRRPADVFGAICRRES